MRRIYTLLSHDRFLQQLGDRYGWVLFRISFTQSPDQLYDTVSNTTWTKEYGPHKISRLEKAVNRLLQEAFQDFAPAHPIFWRHRVEHPFCASRVWFALRDRFKLQLERGREQPTTSELRQLLTEPTKTKTYGRASQPHTNIPHSRTLYNRHTTRPHTHHGCTQSNTPPRFLYTRHTSHTRPMYNTPRLRTHGTTHTRSHGRSQFHTDTPPSGGW